MRSNLGKAIWYTRAGIQSQHWHVSSQYTIVPLPDLEIAYQYKIIGDPPITFTTLGEHCNRYGGSDEDEQCLQGMNAVLHPLIVASKEHHQDS